MAKLLKKCGPKNTPLAKISAEELNKLFHSEIMVTELAKQLKCGVRSIRNKLQRAGIYKPKNRKILRKSLKKRKFGRLKVLKLKQQTNPQLWTCECSCGKIVDIARGHLTSNNTKSCGCILGELGKKNPRYKGFGDVSGCTFNKVRNSAKVRNLKLEITPEYLWKLFLKQGKKCALSGIKLTLHDSRFNYLKKKGQTASVDRIDSSKGYVKGNVQWVHKIIQTMKWDFNQKDFIKFCRKVAKFND